MPASPVVSHPHRKSSSLLSTASYSRNEILEIFERAEVFAKTGIPRSTQPRVLGFLFFEPSTRTRMSFQVAANRLGHNVVTLENAQSSSLSKGESLSDTVSNVVAMGVDALVIRYGDSLELDQLLPALALPVLNAGSGTSAHPTQALLDAFTIQKQFGQVAGKKVLIVGDVRHSRVASSNFDVLSKLGAEIAVCGPWHFIDRASLPPTVRVFDELDEATQWCDVYMGLRIQMERHANDSGLPEARASELEVFHDAFGLTQSRLQKLKKDAMIMHPGPINHGVEFPADSSVNLDPRNCVLKQVSNGVLVRAALIEHALGAM